MSILLGQIGNEMIAVSSYAGYEKPLDLQEARIVLSEQGAIEVGQLDFWEWHDYPCNRWGFESIDRGLRVLRFLKG